MVARATELRFGLAVWLRARLMPLLVRRRDLAPILADAEPGPARPYRGLAAEAIVDAVRRVTRHPWFMRDRRCLRQGLLAYRYLTAAGFRPTLHFGVDRTSLADRRLKAHCWVVLDGRPVIGPPNETMVTIFVYDGPRSLTRKGAPVFSVGDGAAA